MNKFLYVCFLLVAGILFSCSQSVKEEKEKPDNASGKAEESIEERRKKGDTLAFSPDLLLKAFPESLDDYRKEGEGQKAEENTSGMKWSSVSQQYSNGTNTVTVVISDYNAAYGLYAGATAMFNSGISVQSEEEISRPYMKDGKIKGWESFDKATGEASLMLGMNDRFLITIKTENQKDIEALRKFAGQINLNAIY